MKIKKQLTRIGLIWLPLTIFMFFVLTPLLWALSMSLKNQSDIINGSFSILPNPAIITNYIYVWYTNKLSLYFANSSLISFSAVFFIALMSLLNGYVLSRYKFRGKNVFVVGLLMTQMVPAIINLAPLFLMVKTLKLSDTYLSVIILNIAGGIPYNTLLMKGFIGGVPKEIDEAARIDGCTRLQVIYKIIVPIVLPGLVSVIAFAFIGCWNEYLTSYTMLTTTDKFPISVGLKYLIGEFSVNYAALAAGSIISLIPPLILFAYVQKYLVSGMSAGAVKG